MAETFLDEKKAVILELLAKHIVRGLSRSELERLAPEIYGKEINVYRELKELEEMDYVKKEEGRYRRWHITEEGIEALRTYRWSQDKDLGVEVIREEGCGFRLSGTFTTNMYEPVRVKCFPGSITVTIPLRSPDFRGKFYFEIHPSRSKSETEA